MSENAEQGEPAGPSLPYETPPARLLRILSGIVLGPDKLNGRHVGVVLAMAFKEPLVEQQGAWSAAHAELLRLTGDAKDYVKARIPEFVGSPHEKAFNELNEILSTLPLNDIWKTHRERLKPLVSSSLPFSAHDGRMGPKEAPIPEVDAQAVRQKLQVLIDKVKESDWPTAFKTEILETLYNLHDRVNRFHVFGMDGVRQATALVVGTLAINQSVAKSNRELVNDAAEVLNGIADVFLKSYAIAHLVGGQVLRLLGPGA
jgi:hypothetical protein